MRRTWSLWDRLLLAASSVLPALLAVTHASNVADAAHDASLLRTAGLAWTGGLRALEGPFAASFAGLPLGTRAFRAAFASAIAGGLAGGALFLLVRAALELPEVDSQRARNARARAALAPVLAAIASLTATLSPAWQLEAAAPGGSVVGALLAFLPALAWRSSPVASRVSAPDRARAGLALTAFALGLAASYEPLVGLAALASLAPGLLLWMREARERDRASRRGDRQDRASIRLALAFGLLGLAPALTAWLRRLASPELALPVGWSHDLAGERGESGPGVLVFFLRDEVGVLAAGLALLGAAVALRSSRAARRAGALRNAGQASVLVGLAAVAPVAMLCGSPAGPSRFGAPVLLLVAAIHGLASLAMAAGLLAIERARLPFARFIAACLLVLLATFPVRAADEASLRLRARGTADGVTRSHAWEQTTWGALAPETIIFEDDLAVTARFLASRAAGGGRDDVALVPTFDLGGSLASRELARDPSLVPYYRDRALLGAPSEAALAQLASVRPVALTFDATVPSADKRLAFHLVPAGLLTTFGPDPRGASDRRAAYELAATARAPLLARLVSPPDAELLATTLILLHDQATTFAATGERDLLDRALDEIRAVSPGDPLADDLARKLPRSSAP